MTAEALKGKGNGSLESESRFPHILVSSDALRYQMIQMARQR